MRQRRWRAWVFGLLALGLAAGCGDDDETTTGPPPQQTEPDVAMSQITVPQGMQDSDDPMAGLAMAYIQAANGFTNLVAGYLTPPAGGLKSAADGPPWEHVWTDEHGLTITLTIWEEDNKYYWSVELDGTYGEVTYDEWTYIFAWQAKDGKSGDLILYEEATTDILMEWVWSIDASNVYSIGLIVPGDSWTKIWVNPDGSGELEYYDDESDVWALVFEVEWDADGDGSWTMYAGGVQTDSGTWSTGWEPTEPPPAMSIGSVSVPTAMEQSENPMAQMAVGFVAMANAFSSYGAYLTPPGGKAAADGDGPPWEYTWSEGGLTITMTITEVGTEYHWDIVLDGTDGTYTYTDWLVIHAEQAQDGSSGLMIVYEPVTTNILAQWSWSTDLSGVYTFEMINLGTARS